MLKNYCTILLLLYSIIIKAQDTRCGIPYEPFGKELQRRERLATLKKQQGHYKMDAPAIMYVPLTMHLIGKDDGTGYANATDINNAIARLNAKYSAINVSFYFSGSDFLYYTNTALYSGGQTPENTSAFHTAHGVTNAINCYVPGAVTYLDGSNVGGWSYTAPQTQDENVIWVKKSLLNTYSSKIILHEMGHYFNLNHTFNNSDAADVSLRELVTRNFTEQPPRLPANCNDSGDYLCDTPSDPFSSLLSTVTPNCIYISTATDANGDTFVPDVYNIMSYYYCDTYTFTNDQYSRMADGALLVTNATNFTLDAPETIQPAPSGIVAVNMLGDYYGPAVLSWTDNSDAETGYIIEQATAQEGPFIAIGGVATNATQYIDNTVLSGITYYYRVKPSNAKNNYSDVSAGLTSPVYCGNTASLSCGSGDDLTYPGGYINNFTLARNAQQVIANLNSGCQGGATSYFSSFVAPVAPLDQFSFTVQSRAATNGSTLSLGVNVYADWNADGDFEDGGEMMFASETPTPYQVAGTFTAPATFTADAVRLRIMAIPVGAITDGPCNISYGEIEDYGLSTVLAVESNLRQAFKVYPNPAGSTLNIAVNNEVLQSVQVTDVAGKRVFILSGNPSQINIESLASGLYFIKASGDGKCYTAKFIKQ